MASEIIHFRSERARHERVLGREDVFKELDRLLLRDVGTRGWVLVKGGPGMGKSAILAHYLDRLEGNNQRVPHHFLRRGVEGWDRPEVVSRNLAAQVEAFFPAQARAIGGPESRLREVLEHVSAKVLIPRKERLLLVVDGLDEAEGGEDGSNPLPRFLPHLLPKGVQILCSSRPDYPNLAWLEEKEHVHPIELDTPRWAASNQEVVRTYWENVAPRFHPPLDAPFVKEAVHRSEGNVLYAVKLSEWLLGPPEQPRRVELLPRGLDAFLVGIWKRLQEIPQEHRASASDGLGLIAVAREALPLSILAAVLGWPALESRERFLQATRPFLLEVPADGAEESAWQPFHESFRAFITKKLGGETERREHRRLAETLCEWPVKEAGDRFRWRYALRHAVTHWLKAGNWERARTLCTDLGYLEAKCQEVGVTTVVEDLARVAEAAGDSDQKFLFGLHQVVLTGAHWLRGDPRALDVMAYNGLLCLGWKGKEIAEALTFPRGLPALRLRHPVRILQELRTFPGHRTGQFASPRTLNGQQVAPLMLGRALFGFPGTPDGRRVVSPFGDGTQKVWETETGRVLATLEGHEDPVLCCAMTPDGRLGVSAFADRTLKVWETETGKTLQTLKGHRGQIWSCAVTADGQRVVSVSEDGRLKVWDVGTGQALATLQGHGGPVHGCAVTPDGRRMVSVSSDSWLMVWDVETGQIVAQMEPHFHMVGCAVTPDGRLVVSASANGTLKVWEVETGRALATLEGHAGPVWNCAVTPDGRRVVSASEDGTLKVWEVETGRALATLKGHAGPVMGCAVTPDGQHVVSMSWDGTVKVWKVTPVDAPTALLESKRGLVDRIAVTPDGRWVVSTSEGDSLVIVWDLETGRSLFPWNKLQKPDPVVAMMERDEARVSGYVVTLDRRRVVSGPDDGTLTVWKDETPLATLKAHVDPERGIAVTEFGRLVATSREGTLTVWNVETQKAFISLNNFWSRPQAREVKVDERRVVSASDDGTLKIWDLPSKQCLQTLYGGKAFFQVEVSNDVICAGDKAGRVWILEAHPRMPHPKPLPTAKAGMDVGIIIALKEEFRVFEGLLPAGYQLERDEKTGQHDYLFTLPDAGHRCVVTFIGEMNPAPAALHTERLISRWDPRTVVMLGIAAGMHPDVKAGDVVIASQVDDYLASAKAQPGGGPGSFEFSLGGSVYQGDHDFITRVRNLEFAERAAFSRWSQLCGDFLVQNVSQAILEELKRQSLVRSAPELLDAHLASGPVVGAAREFSQWLREKRDRNLKTLDMESAGLMAAAFKRVEPKRTLVIRGISDYGDERKTALDAAGEGVLRRYAMQNATQFLWTLLRAGVLPRASH